MKKGMEEGFEYLLEESIFKDMYILDEDEVTNVTDETAMMGATEAIDDNSTAAASKKRSSKKKKSKNEMTYTSLSNDREIILIQVCVSVDVVMIYMYIYTHT